MAAKKIDLTVKNGLGLTAEYPGTRTNFFVAGFAVRRKYRIKIMNSK